MTTRLLLIWLIVCAGSASAQLNKPVSPLSPSLVRLSERYTFHLAQRGPLPFTSGDPLVAVVGDRVEIDAIAATDVNNLRSELIGLGMVDAVAFGRIVSGHLPLASIAALASVKNLLFARPALAITNAGTVTTQGDVAMRSDLARTTFGVSGAGVTVGVLSDSYNCLGGAATDIANGDLVPVTVIQEKASCSDGTDEGRAMLQIVHDVAPGASLAFATAFGGEAALANNIVALKNSGAKVIVDDVIYLSEPMFQDGIIAQAVDSVVAAGVSYFSSAGNNGRNAYSSAFRPGPVFAPGAFPGAIFFWGGTAHNFSDSGTDVFQRITLPNGAGFIMSFQWDSPNSAVSVGAAGSPNDLDIYLLNANNTQVLAASTLGNVAASGGNGQPVEVLAFTNTTGATADFNIMITRFEGPDAGLMKYVLFRFGGTIQEFATNSSTLFGHANAAGAQAVGAAEYKKTPEFGIMPPQLELFSSVGTTPILFDGAGNRLEGADLRSRKPEIVAPDGADTTFFGSDSDGNGFPNFFGTSAAAPHAAAVAALLLQQKPGLSPLHVYASLENTAIDMDGAGFDNDSGFGLIQADAALAISFDGLANISTRGQVGTADNVMIGGFIIEGPVAKTVLVRARGPSMSGAPFFVSGTLPNPFLRIFSGQTAIAQNDNWQTIDPLCANMGFVCGGPSEIAVTGLDPCEPNPGQSTAPLGCAQESAILITLPPGAYTAIQSGTGGVTGVGLIEAFEVDGGASPSKLINISTRARVEGGDGVMIGGFIIGGSSAKTVAIRARGPSMSGAPFFVPGTLSNPFLRLFSGSTVIGFNDNWQDLQPEEITGAMLSPCDPNPGQAVAPDNCALESGMVVSLPPGGYTAIVTGGIGVGLAEIFELDDVAIPNFIGNYFGSATVTQSSCQNPPNNGSGGFSSVVNIGSQSGSLLTGTGTLSGISVVNLTFSGTGTAGSDLMGSFTFASAIGSGSGLFTGSLSGNAIGINFSGQFTSGETCSIVGSLSGTR